MQRDSVFGWWSRWLSRRGLRRRFGLGPGTENCIKMSEGCYASSVSECVAAVSAGQKLSRLYLHSSFLFQIVPVLSTLSVLSFPYFLCSAGSTCPGSAASADPLEGLIHVGQSRHPRGFCRRISVPGLTGLSQTTLQPV